MSLKIILIEPDLRIIHLMLDFHESNKGELAYFPCVQGSISESLHFHMDESIRVKDSFVEILNANQGLPWENVIELAEGFNTAHVSADGTIHYCYIALFGFDDNGCPFYWARQTDGTSHLLMGQFGHYKNIIISSSTSTASLLTEFLIHQIETLGMGFKKAIHNTFNYATSIDKTVSIDGAMYTTIKRND